MSAVDRDQLRTLAAAATPGPWGFLDGDLATVVTSSRQWVAEVCEERPDAAFIAACDPATVTALCDEADAAEARCAETVETLRWALDSGLAGPVADKARAIVERDEP